MTGYFADGLEIWNNKGHEVGTHLDTGIKMVFNKPWIYIHSLHLKKDKHSSSSGSTYKDFGTKNQCVSFQFH